MISKRIIKSFVFHEDKCWFISTIERDYDYYGVSHRGLETLVWEYDWDENKRKDLVYQAAGIVDHINICKSLIATGEFPKDTDN